MMRFAVLLCLFGVVAGTTLARRSAVDKSAVQKVVEMLQDYKVKISEDLAAEEQEQEEHSAHCDDEIKDRGYAIDTAARKIEDLDALLEHGAAVVKGADADIAALGTAMAAKEDDLLGIEGQRAKEKQDFKATEAELEESVGLVERAINVVQRGGAGAALLQQHATALAAPVPPLELARRISQAVGVVVDAAQTGEGTAKALKGFLQAASEGTESLAGAIQARSEARTGGNGLVETLSDMQTKAQEALSAARTQEMRENHNFQMLKQSITDALATSKKSLAEAKALKTTTSESMGKANGELADVKKTKIADEMFLKELHSDCSTSAKEWEEREQAAKSEMYVIGKAVEILGNRGTVLTQGDDDYTQAQVDASPEARASLVAHLKALGHRYHSYALAELAGAAAEDPFAKIRTLLSDMIAKLTAEANEEATQKSFCDEEATKSDSEKDDKTMRAETLQNRLDTASATIEQLTGVIKAAEADVAELDAAQKSATTLRAKEQATSMKAIDQYKQASEAVVGAVRVLKEYYSSVAFPQLRTSARATSQTPGTATVIIGMLENIGASFSKMHLELTADEQDASDAYRTQTRQSEVAKAAKRAEAANAASEIKGLEVGLRDDSQDLKMTRKELDSVLGYIEKLKPQCETKVVSYAEKVSRRTGELEGLKEALAILDSQ